MELLKIGHYADIQVKARENNLAVSYENNLINIEQIIEQEQLDVVILAGDYWEFDEQTHLETKIMYNHFTRLLKLKCVKEVVLFAGNHDLAKDRKELEASKGTNAIDTFFTLIEKLNLQDYSNKLVYLKEQKQYISPNIPGLGYISYSLEDGSSAGSNLKPELIDKSIFNICVFHDILREYVDQTKLPVKKSVYDRLMSVELFQSNLVIAGDIHKRWETTNLDENIKFYYPGSTLERDFGEGTYIKIRKSINYDIADPKWLLIHEINLQTKTFSCRQIQLKSFINHITLDINSNTLIDDICHKITTSLDKCVFGSDQTFIKLKMSNVFIEQEMDILNAINSVTQNKIGTSSIEFKYDKIIAKNTVSNNMLSAQLVQEVIDENGNTTTESIEITADNVVENFDNIILTESKLIELFKLQLDTNKPALLKELGDEKLLDDVYEHIVKLFAEQINLTMGSIPNFNIVLKRIRTNGFMQLDDNVIDLDIPGLTRITGTNGVGKTQLLNMIRWIVDDLLFENLKTNQKVNNALLVFNDENPLKDDVIVALDATVNNTPIVITRWVKRKWKANVTEQQKKSPEWKKYISDCIRGVKLDIDSVKNGKTSRTGDEAESLIKQWFKNTANTIMILNQFKILSMLNLNSAELRELVLDYIGVDYVYGLDRNIDMIKSNFSLQRPKRNKEEIRKLLTEKSERKNTGNEELRKLDEEKIQLNTENNTLLSEQEQHVNELTKLGNLPELIKVNDNNITNTQSLIDNFELKEKQELPKFEKLIPVAPDTTATQKLLDIDKQSIQSNETNTKTLREQIDSEYTLMYNAFDTNIGTLQNAYNNGFVKLESDEQLIYNEIVEKIKTNKIALINTINTAKQSFIDANIKLQEQITELSTKRNGYLISNTKLQQEIDNGCCNECKRLLDEFTPEHKAAKELEIKNNTELAENIYKQIYGTPENNTGLNSQILVNTNKSNLYQQFIDEINKSHYEYFSDAIVLEYKPLLNGLHVITSDNKLLLESNVKLDNIKRKDLDYVTNVLGLDLYKKIDDKIKEFTSYKNFIVNRQIQLLIDADLKPESWPYINTIKSKLDGITSLEESHKLLKSSIESNETIIKNLNDSYTKDLEIFQTEQTKHNDLINQIVKDNNLVDEHNKQLDVHKTTLNLYVSNQTKYNYEKPIYDDLIRKRDAVKELLETQKSLIDTNVANFNEITLIMSTIQLEIDNLEIEYKDYLKFQKDTAIFNMYSKIIKKDFKDCVFGYYREFLNITLNLLLDEVNFKLLWMETGDLYYYEIKNGSEVYRPVQMVSGMQSCFLGLSLIYAIHTLNVKHSISHIFIDEISGQLNSGKELVNKDNAPDYQEKLLLLLSKFKAKNVFIIDHVIKQMFQTQTYEVVGGPTGSKYIAIE